MRVGVYIDAFNLYYGGRGLCGAGVAGWRWLDVRRLTESLINPTHWVGASINRIVYCTAPIHGQANTSSAQDQDVYMKALRATGSVDHIELGKYIEKVRIAPLATRDHKGRPVLVQSKWPIKIKDAGGQDIPDAMFMASVAYREEKGSDVNVASHLLIDVLTRQIDAAIVISNDSDLRFPVQRARQHVHVGTVNPSMSQLAGDLRGQATDGVGQHFWRQLSTSDFTSNQLPDPAGGYSRPPAW